MNSRIYRWNVRNMIHHNTFAIYLNPLYNWYRGIYIYLKLWLIDFRRIFRLVIDKLPFRYSPEWDFKRIIMYPHRTYQVSLQSSCLISTIYPLSPVQHFLDLYKCYNRLNNNWIITQAFISGLKKITVEQLVFWICK